MSFLSQLYRHQQNNIHNINGKQMKSSAERVFFQLKIFAERRPHLITSERKAGEQWAKTMERANFGIKNSQSLLPVIPKEIAIEQGENDM